MTVDERTQELIAQRLGQSLMVIARLQAELEAKTAELAAKAEPKDA